jgi:2-keto-3-deoxy-L-fuconate dehydrogenase
MGVTARGRPAQAFGQRLAGKRVLVTQADDFMGPAVVKLFGQEGADVIADRHDLTPPDAASSAVAACGHIDILVANLSIPNPRALAHETTDEQWHAVFDVLVHPLHRLVRAVLPQMIARRSGKIVVVGSAAALRGTCNRSCYGAARGAQHAYVKSVGVEVAPHNVQVNATAQIFVENPTYFPPDYAGSEDLQRRLKDVPAGRLATGVEAAAFILFLAGPESDFFCGQVFAYAGGWTV